MLMAPVDGKVSLSLCQMLESEKKAAAAVPRQARCSICS